MTFRDSIQMILGVSSSRKHIAGIVAMLLAFKASALRAAPLTSIQETLLTIQQSTDSHKARQAVMNLRKMPVQNHDDLMEIYGAARSGEKGMPEHMTDEELNRYGGSYEAIAHKLGTCTDSKFQNDIASLLEQERGDAIRQPRIQRAELSPRNSAILGLRQARISSLIRAAGDGKNEKAREVLWKIIDSEKDAYYGQLAVTALGKIGKQEDLDKLMKMKEANPKLRWSFSSFGNPVIQRAISKAKDSTADKDVQGTLLLSAEAASTHDDIPTYVPLLHDKNPMLANAAKNVLANHLQSGDDDLISKMFSDADRQVRVSAALAVNEQAWDPKYIPLLINMLGKDPDYNNRAFAAQVLGKHRVKEAVPALNAAMSDPVRTVKEGASFALKEISGEIPY